MNTLQLLDAVKKRHGITSDYALAKILGAPQPTISSYRCGRRIIDDDMALTIAQELDIDPLVVIAAANAERAKTPEIRARWMSLIEGFLCLLQHAKFVDRRSIPRLQQ